MFKKEKISYSVTKGKCPRCHEGDFFENKLTFNLLKTAKTHENCSNCNLKYSLEPSFFYGAMYVSYASTVAISIITFLISNLIFNATLLQSFAVIAIVLVLLAPVNLRLSRVLWIHIFISYDSQFKKNP